MLLLCRRLVMLAAFLQIFVLPMLYGFIWYQYKFKGKCVFYNTFAARCSEKWLDDIAVMLLVDPIVWMQMIGGSIFILILLMIFKPRSPQDETKKSVLKKQQDYKHL